MENAGGWKGTEERWIEGVANEMVVQVHAVGAGLEGPGGEDS